MKGGLADVTHLPGGVTALALVFAARDWLGREWANTPFYRWMLIGPPSQGLVAAPRHPRPADPVVGRRLLAGYFEMGGAVLDTQGRGDPWDRPSPSARFAAELHRMDWLGDLVAVGDAAHAEALRLILDWSRVFGRWNRFSWDLAVLEARVLNLACAVGVIAPSASAAEQALMGRDLARQARHLLLASRNSARAADRAAIVAIAGTALLGPAGDRLLDKGLTQLERILPSTVLADGGHASRSPGAALDLLAILRTLDQALTRRGIAGPDAMTSAIDRLVGAARFFTLADGATPQFQGAESRQIYLAPATGEPSVIPAGRNGYQRLDGQNLQVLVDAAAPADGDWSRAACAQPLALEVLAGSRRLLVNTGWSPGALGPQALRMADAGSTLSVGEDGCGEPLSGWRARALGPRLVGAQAPVEVRRHETEAGVWLEMFHEGWARRHRLRHERRLFLDLAFDELRGEDRLTPMGDAAAATNRRFIPFAIRFHVHPQVSVSLARDGKSALLRIAGQEIAWRLRSDAQETSVEASAYFKGGVARRTQQVVLRGHARADAGAKVRWKLATAEA